MHFAPMLLAALLQAAPAEAPPAKPAAPAEPAPAATAAPAGVVVVLDTTQGAIKVELDRERAPISVDNFLKYVRKGHYDGTIFHRVIRGFMIQGGGMNASMMEKPTGPPIKNESGNGLSNLRGSIAMARTSELNSATSQFYINHKDNLQLDGGKYAVFGKVIEGMDVVDKIAATPTTTRERMSDVPKTPIFIEKVRVLHDPKAEPAAAPKGAPAKPKPAAAPKAAPKPEARPQAKE